MTQTAAERRAGIEAALRKLLREARENPTPAMLQARRNQQAAYRRAEDITAGRRPALR